jgi:hypothetical protein
MVCTGLSWGIPHELSARRFMTPAVHYSFDLVGKEIVFESQFCKHYKRRLEEGQRCLVLWPPILDNNKDVIRRAVVDRI